LYHSGTCYLCFYKLKEYCGVPFSCYGNNNFKSKTCGSNCSFVSPDHCMVQFVKPNLLGTRKEFLNRFVNPISNGQFEDSTAHDVKIMKRRAHVLHKMLEGSVQVGLFV
jgi:hypothetical protein